MVLVAPDEQTGFATPSSSSQEVEHLRAMAGDAGVVAQALGPEDGVRAAVAKAHHRGAAVEERLRAQRGQHVDQVVLARLDLLEARLAARPRARIVAASGPGTERQNRSGAAAR